MTQTARPLAQRTALLPHRATGTAGPGGHARMTAQWAAVCEAAGAVTALTGGLPTPPRPDLPAQAAAAPAAVRALIGNGIDDLAAVMQPGLRALAAMAAAGRDASGAATALRREFDAAAAALAAVAAAHVPPGLHPAPAPDA